LPTGAVDECAVRTVGIGRLTEIGRSQRFVIDIEIENVWGRVLFEWQKKIWTIEYVERRRRDRKDAIRLILRVIESDLDLSIPNASIYADVSVAHSKDIVVFRDRPRPCTPDSSTRKVLARVGIGRCVIEKGPPAASISNTAVAAESGGDRGCGNVLRGYFGY
jgi:hypothetical protein